MEPFTKDGKILLSHVAMLAALRIGMPGTARVDKEMTAKVRAQEQSRDAKVVKELYGPDAFKPIQSIVTQARDHHSRVTAPWARSTRVGAVGLIRTSVIAEHRSKMAQFAADFHREADLLADRFDDLLASAAVANPTMFKSTDYPTKEAFRSAFKFTVEYAPLPNPRDIVPELPEEIKEDIRDQIIARITEGQVKCMRAVYKRILEQLEHLATKMTETDRSFHLTCFKNIEAIVRDLPKINVTDDPEMEELTAKMEKLLMGLEPKVLAQRARLDPEFRAQMQQGAEDLAAQAEQAIANLTGTLQADGTVAPADPDATHAVTAARTIGVVEVSKGIAHALQGRGVEVEEEDTADEYTGW